MSENVNVSNWLRGTAGAAVGAGVGYLIFYLLIQQGLYGMVIPGACVGFGCGSLSGCRSTAIGVMSGVLSVFLGVFLEWQFFPFVVDDSFTYFVTHLHELKSMSLVMIAIGALFGYWNGQGRGYR